MPRLTLPAIPTVGAPGPGVLALGVFALVLWAQSDTLIGVFYDDGIYVTAAKALAEGQGYRNIHLPGAPPVLHYPPLYPLALSLLWRLWPAFPQNITLFQLFDAAAMAGAAAIMVVHAARLGLPPWLRYGALAVGFAAFPLLTIVGLRLSEPLFLLFMAALLLVVDRDAPCDDRRAVLAGALAGLATLVRSIGVVAIAGAAITLLLRRERRAAAIVIAMSALLLAPWVVWLLAHRGALDPRLTANYGTYVQEAQQAGLAAILAGLDFRALSPLGHLALPAVPAVIRYPLALLLLALLTWGGVVAARSTPALVVSLLLYIVLVSLWPYPPHRFTWLVVPWAAVLLANGCIDAWRRGQAARVAVGVAVLAFGAGFGPRQAISLAERRFAATALGISQPFRLLTAAIGNETPVDAVVAGEDEALVFLHASRSAVPSHLFRWSGRSTADLPYREAVQFFCDARVSYVAVTGPGAPSAPFVSELAARSDSALAPFFRVTDGPVLYRFRCPG